VLGVDGKVPIKLELPANEGLIPGIVDSDEFERDEQDRPLPLVWQWNHNPDNDHWSLTQRPGFLRITTARIDDSLLQSRNMLTQRTIGPECTGTIALDVSGMKDGDFAGLCLLQKQYGAVGVTAVGDTKSIVTVEAAPSGSVNRNRQLPPNGPTTRKLGTKRLPPEQDLVYLRAVCDFRDRADKAFFYYSLDEKTWTRIGEELVMRYTLPHFMGYRFGLFNYATKEAGGHSDFDYFRIRDTMMTRPTDVASD